MGVVVVTVADADGRARHGFSWTPSIGARAVRALIDDDLAPFFIGKKADANLWQAAWERVHEAGGGGITTIALAGIDTALWDLRARVAESSVAELIGRRHESLPVYGSGVNVHY